jgi:hypothetical protein
MKPGMQVLARHVREDSRGLSAQQRSDRRRTPDPGKRWGPLLVRCLLALIIAATVSAGARPEVMVRVLDVQFEPIRPGMNVVRVQMENTSAEKRVVHVHIYSRSPQYGRNGMGWGAGFFLTLDPNRTQWLRCVFKIQGPITPDTYVRLAFHDAGRAESFDRKAYHQTDQSRIDFTPSRYDSQDLPQQALDNTRPEAASETEADAVKETLRRYQDAIRGKEYERAWELLAEDYRKTEFWGDDGFERFRAILGPERSPLAAFVWDKDELLRLQPAAVTRKGRILTLTALCDGRPWWVDFVEEEGRWKIGWIGGYVPQALQWQDWETRVLPEMNKRRTPHFDIYCARGSTADKDMDRIAREREKAYAEIRALLGDPQEVRIRLVFFEDEATEFREVGHQGMGWAFAHTIVEVYGGNNHLDPYHEITHILARGKGTPPALFVEGLAIYVSQRLGGHALEHLGGGRASTEERVRALQDAGQLIGLEELLTYAEIGTPETRPYVAYAQAGSFVKFLIEQYGRGKFLQAYQTLVSSNNEKVLKRNVEALEQIYGTTIKELERQWLQAVRNGAGKPASQATDAGSPASLHGQRPGPSQATHSWCTEGRESGATVQASGRNGGPARLVTLTFALPT